MDQNEGSKNSGKEKKNGEQSEANESNISKKEKKGPQQTIKRSKTAATANPARKKSRHFLNVGQDDGIMVNDLDQEDNDQDNDENENESSDGDQNMSPMPSDGDPWEGHDELDQALSEMHERQSKTDDKNEEQSSGSDVDLNDVLNSDPSKSKFDIGEYQPEVAANGILYLNSGLYEAHKKIKRAAQRKEKKKDGAELELKMDEQETENELPMTKFKMSCPNSSPMVVHLVKKAYHQPRKNGGLYVGVNDTVAIYQQDPGDTALKGFSSVRPNHFFKWGPQALVCILASHPQLWSRYGSPRSLLQHLAKTLRTYENQREINPEADLQYLQKSGVAACSLCTELKQRAAKVGIKPKPKQIKPKQTK